MSFAQILEEKMKQSPLENKFPQWGNATQPLGIEPAHLAFLIGHVQRRTPVNLRKSPYPKAPPTPRKPHVLTETQQLSWSFFTESLPELPAGFTRHELKTAFRQLALVFHPDRGGCAQKFMQLRSHYQCLMTIFAAM